MSTSTKVIMFGIISGQVWSVILESLDLYNDHFTDYGREFVLSLFSGALTGLAVSFALTVPIIRLGWSGTLIAGLISLPLGAFIFGVISSFLSFSFNDGFTGSQYGFFTIFLVGGEFALLSVMSFFAVVFFPLAVLTTFVFRAVIQSDRKLNGGSRV